MKKIMLTLVLVVSGAMAPLFAEMKVLAFAGSTRSDSYNKKLIEEAAAIAKEMGAKVTVIDLKNYPMPFYDGDLEAKQGVPKNAKRLRELMVQSDAIIIASPEYNSSLAPVLKNALDWVSRDEGNYSAAALEGKKFGIMSASPGRGGGARGLVHLRGIIEAIGGDVVQTQVTIPTAHNYFSEKKKPAHPLLKQELQELLQPKLAASDTHK